jgi:hypothetical protein
MKMNLDAMKRVSDAMATNRLKDLLDSARSDKGNALVLIGNWECSVVFKKTTVWSHVYTDPVSRESRKFKSLVDVSRFLSGSGIECKDYRETENAFKKQVKSLREKIIGLSPGLTSMWDKEKNVNCRNAKIIADVGKWLNEDLVPVVISAYCDVKNKLRMVMKPPPPAEVVPVEANENNELVAVDTDTDTVSDDDDSDDAYSEHPDEECPDEAREGEVIALLDDETPPPNDITPDQFRKMIDFVMKTRGVNDAGFIALRNDFKKLMHVVAFVSDGLDAMKTPPYRELVIADLERMQKYYSTGDKRALALPDFANLPKKRMDLVDMFVKFQNAYARDEDMDDKEDEDAEDQQDTNLENDGRNIRAVVEPLYSSENLLAMYAAFESMGVPAGIKDLFLNATSGDEFRALVAEYEGLEWYDGFIDRLGKISQLQKERPERTNAVLDRLMYAIDPDEAIDAEDLDRLLTEIASDIPRAPALFSLQEVSDDDDDCWITKVVPGDDAFVDRFTLVKREAEPTVGEEEDAAVPIVEEPPPAILVKQEHVSDDDEPVLTWGKRVKRARYSAPVSAAQYVDLVD